MMESEFVPGLFAVPSSFEGGEYRLEILTPAFVELDFDAVMSSRSRLRSVFAESTEWPRDDMTLEDNLEDLKRHEQEFKDREAFAYTMLSNTKDRCLGCVYIVPCESASYGCAVFLWVRDDSLNLDNQLYADVRSWLQEKWPFQNVAFPGREIPWGEWSSSYPFVA